MDKNEPLSQSNKDAEVRARVSKQMFADLSAIAEGRNEQLPVILREALTEYLARRSASAGTKYPMTGSDALLQILSEQPEVAKTLIALGNLLKPAASAGPQPPVAEPPPETPPVDYKPRHRPKRPPAS